MFSCPSNYKIKNKSKVRGGGGPGFLKRGFICIKVWGVHFVNLSIWNRYDRLMKDIRKMAIFNDLLSHSFPLLSGCGRMLSSNLTLVTVISKVRLYGKAYCYVRGHTGYDILKHFPSHPSLVMLMDVFCCTFIAFVPTTYRVWKNAVQ